MNLNDMATKAHEIATSKGFWVEGHAGIDRYRIATFIGLIHTEVSELMEAHRSEEKTIDDMGEEMADIIIRVGDLAAHYRLDLDYLVAWKMAKNEIRPVRHGKRY